MGQPDVSANDRSFANRGFSPQNSSAGVNRHIVLHVGVAFDSFDGTAFFVQREAQCSEGDALVDFDIFSDHAGFADDDARAVVNEEGGADLRSRVNINPRLGVGVFGQDPGDEGNFFTVEDMGDPMCHDGEKARITHHDFHIRLGSRVSCIGGFDILLEDLLDLRQFVEQRMDSLFGMAPAIAAISALVEFALVAKSEFDLPAEGGADGVQFFFDIAGQMFRRNGLVTVATWEQHGDQILENFMDGLATDQAESLF